MVAQGEKTLRVDFHTHALSVSVESLVQGRQEWLAELKAQSAWNGEASTRRNWELFQSTYRSKLSDVKQRITDMDKMGIDIQVVSPSPTQYYYWADPDLGSRIARRVNEDIAALCSEHPDRLVGLATVTLQHPELAVEQLGYAVQKLGLCGAEISTRVNDAELANERFEPFWRRAEELGAAIFIHPLGCTLGERLSLHYLSNVVGQPIETTIALSHLIFGGVLDRYPRLRICAAHGGGYLPHYIGRSNHAYTVRPESRGMKEAPIEYLRRIWFDSLVYDPAILRRLIDVVGASQVVIGSDYPFDMGVEDPIARLESVPGLTDEERRLIVGANADELLGGRLGRLTDRRLNTKLP